MSWRDRLKQPAITPPTGERFTFEYEDVEKEVNFKTNQFTFGDKQGALVQDFGLGVVSFPLTLYMSGTDYDAKAAAFETAISFPGSSLLEHPMYGNHNVIIESYTRSDKIKTAGNQARFEMVITETIIPAAPVSALEAKSNIIGQMNALSEIQQTAFDAQYGIVSDLITARDRITQFVSDISAGFENIVSVNQEISDAFDASTEFITENIDELLEDVPALAGSLYSLIRIPARSTASISSRVQAYIDTMATQIRDIEGAGIDLFNQFTENQLLLTSELSAMSEATLFSENDLITKADATGLAGDILDQYRLVQEYLDGLEVLAIDDPLTERYSVNDALAQFIKSITSSTAGNLILLSFSLKQERIITLEETETIITLCQKLYGGRLEDPIVPGLDKTKLDFLIETNMLNGRELIIIPIGREIKYYV